MMAFVFWVVIGGLVGVLIGQSKGEGGSGCVLGALLGPIGWLILALMKGNRKTCPFCRSQVAKEATICPQCQKSQNGEAAKVVPAGTFAPVENPDERTCPFCAETIKSAAKVCRFCNREVGPTA